ncbi:MAG TPA: ribonuclease H-like domain-containing protein [Ignavibacteriaceae bacterium]|nr:ribonuclease H-like domain-containing protein [Ignavibacteriaceae bacterium]
MRTIVFDIETSAYPFESLAESQREYLLRYAEKEPNEKIKTQKIDDAIRYTSLYPFTSKIVAIGIYDIEKNKSFVYYESNNREEWQAEDKQSQFKGLDENEMLKSFWKIIEFADKVVTFNGRTFDAPFLMLRSAMLKIKPTKYLITNRYDKSFHIDLLDQFTYYGLTRKFNLDFYCNAFGIESPKSKGISGMDVKNLYEAGKTKEIAIYCGNDVLATSKLFKIWADYLDI